MTMIWTPEPTTGATQQKVAERTVDRTTRRKIRDAFAKASSDRKATRPRNAGLCL